MADTGEAAANRLRIADRVDAEGIGWLADAMLPTLLADVARVGEQVRALIDDQTPAGVAWAQRAMAARPDSTELLRDSGVPMLVITGAQDTLIPPELARQLAETAGADLKTIDDCGHLPSLEQPARFAEAVTTWIQRA